MKKLVIGTLLASICIVAASSQASLMQTLAVVKYTEAETVTVKEVKDIVETQEKEVNRKLSPQERELIYETVINQKLVLQAAKKAGVVVQASEVDQAFLQNIAQQLKLNRVYSEKELNDYVMQAKKMSFSQFVKEETGMTIDEVKNTIVKPDLIWQRYLLMQNSDKLQRVVATDKEIRDYYELNKVQFTRPDSLKMLLVAVPKQDNPNAKTKASGLLADLKGNKINLEKLRTEGADLKNAGYGSADVFIMKIQQHAAQLGITYERLLAMFDEGMNKPSELIETTQAFQFYVILEKYPFKVLELSDVVRPDSTQTVYEIVRNLVTQTKQYQFLEQARQDTIKSLNTPEYVQRKKTGDDLKKALSW